VLISALLITLTLALLSPTFAALPGVACGPNECLLLPTASKERLPCSAKDAIKVNVAVCSTLEGACVKADPGSITCEENSNQTFRFIFTISAQASERFDVGVLLADTANFPFQKDAIKGVCCAYSLASPPDGGFASSENPVDACGDIPQNSISTLLIKQKVACKPEGTSKNLAIPYCGVWNQNKDIVCNGAADVSNGSPSKCDCMILVVDNVVVFTPATVTVEIPANTACFDSGASVAVPFTIKTGTAAPVSEVTYAANTAGSFKCCPAGQTCANPTTAPTTLAKDSLYNCVLTIQPTSSITSLTITVSGKDARNAPPSAVSGTTTNSATISIKPAAEFCRACQCLDPSCPVPASTNPADCRYTYGPNKVAIAAADCKPVEGAHSSAF